MAACLVLLVCRHRHQREHRLRLQRLRHHLSVLAASPLLLQKERNAAVLQRSHQPPLGITDIDDLNVLAYSPLQQAAILQRSQLLPLALALPSSLQQSGNAAAAWCGSH